MTLKIFNASLEGAKGARITVAEQLPFDGLTFLGYVFRAIAP